MKQQGQGQQTPEERAIARAERGQDRGRVSSGQTAPFFQLLERAQPMIAQVASGILNPSRLIYIARAGLSRNPDLLQCTPLSWVGALMDCAQLGLEPIGALGQFYFVPYRNNQKGGVFEVQGQLGYLGISELARRSGDISYIKSEAVFEGDQLEVVEGSNVESAFKHIPNYAQRSEVVIAAWAKVAFKDGSVTFKVVDKNELTKARKHSRGAQKGRGPWVDWEPQMAAKTAVRRMRPSLPQNIMLSKALAVDEHVDLGIDGARWRDLGEKAEEIDGMLEDLTKPERVIAQVPEQAQLEDGKAGGTTDAGA